VKILYPDLHLTLLEPSLKKTAFLRHLVGTLHVNDTEVISKRLQDFARDPSAQGRFSYVMTRALSLSEILPFVRPVLAPQGRLILCRTKPLEAQVEARGLRKIQEIGYTLPYGYGKRVLSILSVVDGV
jgi:16S rRNA (guanine527-N7)-methyltransferase